MGKTNNIPKHVLFEPEYVGWKGLMYAIDDAFSLKIPLAVYEQHKARVLEYIAENELENFVKVIVVEEKK